MVLGNNWYKGDKNIKELLRKLIGYDSRGIAHIERYSNKPNMFKESVAEHSFYVSYYSLVFGRFLVKKGYKVNFGKLLARAIVHDFEENFTGDLLAPFKHRLDVGDEINKVARERMLKDDYSLWENAKDGSIEGKIISFADKFCVVVKCVEEISSGNKNYLDILKFQIDKIKKDKTGLFSEIIRCLDVLVKDMISKNS